ncbi:MAG: ABC transporter permease subunit [Chloroflexaceae bacterium]|nr:ABC transporter permease subunit [Chloroflexaceae bacterium]
MSVGAISTITRREVREMAGDWRIMVPIFLLTFILPLMLVGASSRMINFVVVENDMLAQRLIPVMILLVGFIPSSFSLITALESFVGERERNSLEALLAMPISDHDLYAGKLISSLVAPLLSSYTAMLLFGFMLYATDPVLYFGAMTTTRLGLLFLSIGLMSLTMVAGAVVISSHISSIRAANLMSSFILVPMALVVQMDAILIINGRWDVMWVTGAGLLVLAVLLLRMGLVTFNREGILSREHQQASDRAFSRIFTIFSRFSRRDSSTDRPSAPPRPGQRSALLTIARRELRESVTDWRVLVPFFVLTFVIPLALVSIMDFAIEFVGNFGLIALLVPFMVLLVGFIPASFSLIVALDSFVGERERNSLEALLSLPISDNLLYAGKLVSSLVPPILTSFGAMLVFSLAMAVVHPTLYYASMTTERLLQLLLMISIMTVVMVAGAVIISSHTGSIRAANLLASFVLIPMAAIVQFQALLIIARRWDAMWMVTLILMVASVALVRTGLAAFNREEILSREHEEFNLQVVAATLGTFFREYQPAGVLPSHYHGAPFSPRRFYRQELPALLRDLRLPIVIALIAAVGGWLIGQYVSSEDFRFIGGVQQVLDGMANRVGEQVPRPSPGLALFIFANNLRVSLLSNIFSVVAFGVFAFMVPAFAFMQVGFVSGRLANTGGSWTALGNDSPLQFMLAYVLPHGIIELPTFILSAALGLRIGVALLSPPGGFSVGQHILWSLANFLKFWLLVLLPLILLGSLVEGLISPLIIQALYQ